MTRHTCKQRVRGAGYIGLWRVLAVVSCAALLSGCGALPSDGPRAGAFEKARWEYISDPTTDDKEKGLHFVLVDVDRKVVENLAVAEDSTYFKGAFTDHAPPADLPLGVGDTLRITIFEAGPGGLFLSNGGGAMGSGGNYITLPDQEVDQSGHISVPYAGKDGGSGLIKVAGHKTTEVQHDIQQRLMNKAIEPQVIVTLVKRTSNLFSVIGDVGNPGRFSLDQGGVRVLDALSVAGGPKNNDYNTLVTLQRGGTSATVRLSVLLAQSDNNIFVQPGDLIAVKKDERYYNVLGATNANNRVAFEAEKVTVADALAKAGGLNRDAAEPEAVVVFRREDPKTLESLGVNLEGVTSAEPIPTVYRFNMSEAAGMFLAQRMELRNNDAVYVSTHGFNDISKLMGTLRDVLLIKFIND